MHIHQENHKRKGHFTIVKISISPVILTSKPRFSLVNKNHKKTSKYSNQHFSISFFDFSSWSHNGNRRTLWWYQKARSNWKWTQSKSKCRFRSHYRGYSHREAKPSVRANVHRLLHRIHDHFEKRQSAYYWSISGFGPSPFIYCCIDLHSSQGTLALSPYKCEAIQMCRDLRFLVEWLFWEPRVDQQQCRSLPDRHSRTHDQRARNHGRCLEQQNDSTIIHCVDELLDWHQR